MKTTSWFPASVKPVRVGVYQQKCGFGEEIGYQYWDGTHWGTWEETPDRAERVGIDGRFRSISSDPWRGLARPAPGERQS